MIAQGLKLLFVIKVLFSRLLRLMTKIRRVSKSHRLKYSIRFFDHRICHFIIEFTILFAPSHPTTD